MFYTFFHIAHATRNTAGLFLSLCCNALKRQSPTSFPALKAMVAGKCDNDITEHDNTKAPSRELAYLMFEDSVSV